jgi:hypothetical protein
LQQPQNQQEKQAAAALYKKFETALSKQTK